MKEYKLKLECEASNSYRCQKAANSLDIDVGKKLTHVFNVNAELDEPYNVGVIVGASGSGKTTLAEMIWGDLSRALNPKSPVIDQFPEFMDYNDCVKLLSGVGLTSVPCWIRPAETLSNGQKERAEIALQMARSDNLVVIDEWTSVVDRTVAKVMSHSIQKWARAIKRRVVLLTCHYDVLDWLQPDWVIDCNKQEFIDNRGSKKNEANNYNSTSGNAAGSAWKHFGKVSLFE